MVRWLKSIKDRVQPKQEWSKEDEDRLDIIFERIERGLIVDKDDIDRLKSLKERVQPQPKQEWSDEDEEMHRRCICAMRASACGFPEEEKFVEQVDNWLKSLRPQSTWKPCDYELEVLRLAAEKDGTCLMGLYEQLKKLKG